MQKNREFRSLLSLEEYNLLIGKFSDSKSDVQTNHYYDTPRFSLKAQEMFLKIKEREGSLELSFKYKKNYQHLEIVLPISYDELNEINKTGVISYPEIISELSSIIKEQKLVNFLSLSTTRNYFSYANGSVFLDQNCFCFPTVINDGEIAKVIDYEIEYEAKNYDDGITEFISLIKEYNLSYKKTDKKIKRAFNTYKLIH